MLPTVPPGCKILIIDNAEADEDLPGLARQFNATLIKTPKNEGFGRACNLGLQKAETEFVFFLNPDTRLETGAIDALLEAAAQYGRGAAFNPKISDNKGRPHFKRRSVLLPSKKYLPRGWPLTDREVPVLAGSAIFVRRKNCLPFDPAIFMYHEDDDWSLRMQEAGHKLYFVAAARITHASGHSSGRSEEISAFKAYHLGRSRVYAMRKHGVALPFARSMTAALRQLFSPAMVSARKRAKQFAFLRGVWSMRAAQTLPYED